MTFLRDLKLRNFRSYGQVYLSGLEQGVIVLSGANGAGKTNILEAISLFSPGRGLRGAKVQEMQRLNAADPWAAAGELESGFERVMIGTGLDEKSEKRVVRINGRSMRGQSSLAEYMACIWLTPQMDRLFLDSSRERRKFLDRLVFAFDPGHAGRVTRYENALRQRSRLLAEGRMDEGWLSGLEAQIAEIGVAIAAARLEFSSRLQKACDRADTEHFPRARIFVQGTIEDCLRGAPALEVEAVFAGRLRDSRARDAVTGGAASGPHKSDLQVVYAAKGMDAAQCSTGEQKALLIGLVLAHARLISAERGAAPILLLDEVAAHLDEERRAALYGLLGQIGGQVWLTGTERSLFEAVDGKAKFFEVRDGGIS